jgi:hypothetical protein|tara:strand:- start:392 stop:577 length:186 start_codon:yes stop_codon:yes gene_type:complete
MAVFIKTIVRLITAFTSAFIIAFGIYGWLYEGSGLIGIIVAIGGFLFGWVGNKVVMWAFSN